MENIKINEIDKKDSGLVIVKYNDNKEATMNTKWQGSEVDFLIKEVGIGGCVYVTITPKGEYINITAVDRNSAVMADNHSSPKPTNAQAPTATERPIVTKDDSIVAQMCTKCVFRNVQEPAIEEVVVVYKKALSLLEA